MQGRSQKWPMKGVLRPEIVKGGSSEGTEVPERPFVRVLLKMTKKFGPVGGGVLTPISPPLAIPLNKCSLLNNFF